MGRLVLGLEVLHIHRCLAAGLERDVPKLNPVIGTTLKMQRLDLGDGIRAERGRRAPRRSDSGALSQTGWGHFLACPLGNEATLPAGLLLILIDNRGFAFAFDNMNKHWSFLANTRRVFEWPCPHALPRAIRNTHPQAG